MKAKYVMTDKGPILFGQAISHDAFRHLKPISAGFVDVDEGHYTAYGKSVSLGLASKKTDSILIEVAFEESL